MVSSEWFLRKSQPGLGLVLLGLGRGLAIRETGASEELGSMVKGVAMNSHRVILLSGVVSSESGVLTAPGVDRGSATVKIEGSMS